MGGEIVFQTPWFSIERENFDELKFLEGKPYYRLNCPNSVAILPITEERKVVMVKQFRPSFREYAINVPGGYIDLGESPLYAAGRELYEETGYFSTEFIEVGSGRTSERVNHLVTVFCALGVKKDKDFVAREEIEVIEFSLIDLKKMMLEGKMNSLPTFAAIMLAKWKIKEAGFEIF